jgi:hypothetical protein
MAYMLDAAAISRPGGETPPLFRPPAALYPAVIMPPGEGEGARAAG